VTGRRLRTPYLVEHFKDHVKGRHRIPKTAQKFADHTAALETELKDLKAELARERETSAYFRRVITELSIELE
jgi:hypothetical protein